MNHTVTRLNTLHVAGLMLVALAALTGCDEPDPAKDIRADCTNLTYEFYVCDVPMPDGRVIPCVSKSGNGGAMSCDWSPN